MNDLRITGDSYKGWDFLMGRLRFVVFLMFDYCLVVPFSAANYSESYSRPGDPCSVF